MTETGDSFSKRSDALRESLDAVPGGIDGLTCAQDSDLVEILVAAQSVVLSGQGVLAAVAGEIARRSSGANDRSLARRLGERSARGLVASRANLPFPEASRLVNVGEAIRPNQALSGEALPADRPHIAEAVLAGRLSLQLAELIDTTIEKVEHRLLRDAADLLEEELVARATDGTWSVADFTAYCRRIPDRLDPDGAKPRDEALRAKASIRETWLQNGMLRIVAELDPERAAFYRAAMTARTNPRRPAATAEDGSTEEGPEVGHDRTQSTPAQSRLEAFLSILRDSLRAEDGKQAGVDTTVLVRIDLDALLTGIGSATLDGVGEPISAAAARRLAVEADIIPQVFGGRSQFLDQGTARRIFTKAQRYALLATYSGCAFPKCDVPSSVTEIHHVGQWATRHSHQKGTDLLNGLPLCPFHNRLMEQGWEIEFDDDRVPWFIPPPLVDFWQRRLRGGNLIDDRAA